MVAVMRRAIVVAVVVNVISGSFDVDTFWASGVKNRTARPGAGTGTWQTLFSVSQLIETVLRVP